MAAKKRAKKKAAKKKTAQVKALKLPAPKLQIDFSKLLINLRAEFLNEALSQTVGTLTIGDIDKELSTLVKDDDLKLLAQKGLRGELLFPVPVILETNPKLFGYYRLLLGFSQKAFYSGGTGMGQFRNMEDKGIISPAVSSRIPELCNVMIACASKLLKELDHSQLSADFLDDLTLLTLGPQLRGGTNVQIGTTGNLLVFKAIAAIVKSNIVEKSLKKIEILNAPKRKVLIEFASDPDISIREQMDAKTFRNIIAIEIKGGKDFSNIHNRIGEAEKSHQKAKQRGFTECWTVVNVDNIDLEMARQESPTTNKFYRISDITSGKGTEYTDFKNRIVTLTSIPNPK